MNAAVGTIVMWGGGVVSDIPEGWALYDGQNGTPDLRDRFVLGAGNKYEIGNTGGSEEITLTINQMPSHTHSMTVRSSVSGNATGLATNTGTASSSISFTNYTGSSKPYPNMPPYYELCFIMKVAS